MIEVISSWAKSLGVTIVLVSILEMILPNNKTKKYIRMVLGLFVIFNIIAPFIQNKGNLSIASINIEDYTQGNNTNIVTNTQSETLNQTSMDKRIKVLYQDELEKDVIKKIEELGYEVGSCKVEAEVPTEESSGNNETGITKIELKINGKLNNEDNSSIGDENQEEESLENKIVTGVQRIKEVDVSGDGGKRQQESNTEDNQANEQVTRSDFQNIRKFLIEEYGVSEKCLEIN